MRPVKTVTTQRALIDHTVTTNEVRAALRAEHKAHMKLVAEHHGVKRKLSQVESKLDTAATLLRAEHAYGIELVCLFA